MSYYSGDYYMGDYYMGDPGLLSTLGNIVKKGVSIAGALVGASPAGAVIRAATGNVPVLSQPSLPTIETPGPMQLPTTPYMGLPVTGGAIAGYSTRSFMMGGKWYHYNKKGELKKGKKPTMDSGNVKALRRADRRMNSFVGIARSALKHTHYKVVTKGTGRRGSRGVITRSEAARALRS